MATPKIFIDYYNYGMVHMKDYLLRILHNKEKNNYPTENLCYAALIKKIIKQKKMKCIIYGAGVGENFIV